MNEQMQVWAHEYAMNTVKSGANYGSIKDLVGYAVEYAEAMQAQAEERRAPEPDLCNHDWQPIYELNIKCNEVCSLCGALRMDW